MTKVRVEINRSAARRLLRGPEVQADLRRRAEAIAATAGEGMEADVSVGRNRARAAVVTASFEARVAEAEQAALTRALDAGR